MTSVYCVRSGSNEPPPFVKLAKVIPSPPSVAGRDHAEPAPTTTTTTSGSDECHPSETPLGGVHSKATTTPKTLWTMEGQPTPPPTLSSAASNTWMGRTPLLHRSTSLLCPTSNVSPLVVESRSRRHFRAPHKKEASFSLVPLSTARTLSTPSQLTPQSSTTHKDGAEQNPLSQGYCLPIYIEGKKTGEEKIISAPSISGNFRRPLWEDATVEDQGARRDAYLLTKSQKRIRTLEAEIARITARAKSYEEDANRWKEEYEKAQAQIALEIESRKVILDKNASIQNKVSLLGTALEHTRRYLGAQHLLTENICNGFQEKIQIFLTTMMVVWQSERERSVAERERLCNCIRMLEEQHLAHARKAIMDRDAMLEKQESVLRTNHEDLTRTLERTQHELKTLNQKLAEGQEEVHAARRTSAAFGQYMRRICQPHFRVIKSPSKDRSVSGGAKCEDMNSFSDAHVKLHTASSKEKGDAASGTSSEARADYVLVPLRLMLEGYGLLPQNLKDAIASEYAESLNHSKKDLG